MAKTIATIGGVGLAPGVSKNRRWYTDGIVSRAASRLQERIDRGDAPPVMLSFHGADDNSREITASLTKASVDGQGRLRFEAGIADTAAGRDIAALADTSDGRPPHLKTVSIRGYWLGEVRKVTGPDGQPAETAQDISIEGIDFTKNPGVTGAEVDTFAWAGDGSKTETSERVYITESVQEARVTITEETGPATAPVISEAVLEVFGGGHVLEDGLCVTCEASVPMGQRGSGMKGAGKTWADPGYQADKKQRYDLSTKANAKAAWSYVNQADNAKKYSAAQLKRIKGRIKAALGKFGVSVAAESGWLVGEPASVSEAVAEWWPGDYCSSPGTAGSYCLTASNGPTSLTISSYSLDPEDLDPVLRAAADAACKALAALDPDMDGDIDVDGATGDAAPDEAAEPGDLTETTTTDPAADLAAEPHTETEVPAMADTATPAVEASPAAPATAPAAPQTVTLTTEQFQQLLARTAPAPATETAPAAPPAPAATEASPAAPVTETADQRMARLSALADAKVAEAAQKAGLSVTETDEQIMERLLEERLVPLRQAAAERTGAGTGRKGLLEDIAEQAPGTTKMLQEASAADLAALAAAAYPAPGRR